MKIIVLNEPTGLPSSFLVDSRLYLDLNERQNIELSKALSELSNLNEIQDEAALGLTIPSTAKNNWIAGYIRSFNRIGNTYQPLSVSVVESGVVHNFTKLYFKGFNDSDNAYDVEIRRGDDHWLELAEKTYLYQSNLGTFEFTKDNIESNWTNNDQYADGDIGIYFPLVHYGGWWRKNEIVVEDMRPWFHLLAILQKVFCEVGWNFRCPWLETDTGRRLGAYLGGDSYGQSYDQLTDRSFRAHIEGDVTTSIYYYNSYITAIPFDTIDENPGGYYDGVSYVGGVVIADFITSIDVTVEWITTGPDGDRNWSVRIIRLEGGSGNEEILAEQSGTLETTDTSFSVELKAANVNVYNNQYIYVQVQVGTQIIRGISGIFYNEPKKAFYERGETINLAETIDPDLSLLDFLKGVTHLCNGKFKTDWINKTIWLYTPRDVEWHSNSLDGFYDNTPVTLDVLYDSQVITIENQDLPRYVRLQFKGVEDSYISRLNVPPDEPLYSKNLDLGGGLEETEVLDNPIFQPTQNGPIDKWSVITPFLVNYGPDVPFLWDNDNGQISFKLGYRICYFEGEITQPYEDGDGVHVQTRAWRWETGTKTTVPYAYQVPGAKKRESFVNIALDTRIVYGDDDNDFYNLGYREELLRRNYAAIVAYDAIVSAGTYKEMDFRSLYRIEYAGRVSHYRAIEVNGRESCTNKPVQIVFLPEPYEGDVCSDTNIVMVDDCPNQPRINIEFDLSKGDIKATADDSGISSTIDTDTWEYSLDGGANWVSYTVDTFISPSPGETSILFRRTVTFTDDCPDKVVTRTGDLETQCENNPSITIAYDDGTNTASATGSGDFTSSIATDTWTVSTDGGAASAYTPGDDVSGFSTVTFQRTVTFTDVCPDIIVSQTLEPSTPICINNPDLILTEVADCIYDLSVGGTVDSSICMTYIEVSRDGGTTWKQWDGKPLVVKSSTKVRLTVNYCDHCPASYIEKDCPVP